MFTCIAIVSFWLCIQSVCQVLYHSCKIKLTSTYYLLCDKILANTIFLLVVRKRGLFLSTKSANFIRNVVSCSYYLRPSFRAKYKANKTIYISNNLSLYHSKNLLWSYFCVIIRITIHSSLCEVKQQNIQSYIMQS